jgi:hypothetical protein
MFDVFYFNNKPNLFAHEREVKSVEEAQELSRTRFFWIVDYLCDYSDFDFLWEPKPWEAAQRHVYASQHQKDSGTCLYPKYGWNGETNYHAGMIATRKPTTDNWDCLDVEGFDYSWHPDPTEPPFVYKFGTQWQKTGGPTYTVPGAVNVKYVAENRVCKTAVDEYWDDTSYTNFDYTWHPDATEDPYIYEFGTQWQKTGGPRYVMPGATVTKYVSEPRITKETVDDNWEVPLGVELEGFDYTWHPDATEPPYDYQFGTQWQKTGGPLYRIPGATATKYVTQERVKSISVAREVYLIDHGNAETETVKQQLEDKGLTVKKVARFIASYKGTLQRILRLEENEFVWVCSSVCDYSDFDFSWHPELWQGTMLHVFPSNEEKFGDTFLINVPTFNDRIQKTEILEWYDTIHFVDSIPVPRYPMPVIHYDSNSVVETVKAHTFETPLVLFTDGEVPELPTIPLWREKTRVIAPLNKGNSIVIVPRDAKTAILRELYDYPHIDTTYRTLSNNKPLDVVFISNGEKNAEENWVHLQRVMEGKPNRLVRSDKVDGRAAAYCAALNSSETPWAFCVFAKLTVDENFDWSWQPDRMQVNKHYIFIAKNPVNGLEYGHMAMIAYHKDLVLANEPTGLDFTLDQEHEVVPLLSGVANYADDILTAWRSAFREALKLRNDQTTMDNQYRLKQWLTRGEGEIGEWSVKGAKDAVEYWESVNGNFEKLRLSYEWSWLKEYFVNRYGFEPDQQ